MRIWRTNSSYPAFSDAPGDELCLQVPRNQRKCQQGAPFLHRRAQVGPGENVALGIRTQQTSGTCGASVNRALVRELARNLLESKKREAKEGATRRDVMSLLGMLNVFPMGQGGSAYN